MKKFGLKIIFAIFLLALGSGCKKNTEKKNKSKQPILKKVDIGSFYNIQYTSIENKKMTMGEYRGKVIMVVNTASKCRFTPQLKGLEKIYQKYKKRGFVIIGFPCNQFLAQEPGKNSQILNFCQTSYGVSFPLSEKIEVNGSNKHQLYNYLTNKNARFPGMINWNFQKFLINREGKVVARFNPGVRPESKKIIESIEKSLGKNISKKK